MKKIYALLPSLLLALALGACNKPAEPVLSNDKDSIKDATDSRPHEKMRDAVENTGDKIKQEAGEAKDAVKGENK